MTLLPDHRDRPAARRGQALVELAIALPLLMLLLLIAIDFGRVFHTHISLANAAREGASYAASNPADLAAGGSGARTQARAELSDPSIVVQISCNPDASCASRSSGTTPAGHQRVTVTVSTDFFFLTPFISDGFGTLWGGINDGAGMPLSRSATAVIP